jgi:hypothetical protein
MTARSRAACVVVIVLMSAAFISALLFQETLQPRRSDVLSVEPGMTRQDVVKLLGVLYDGCAPGECDDFDRVIGGMDNSDSIAYASCWRIGWSRDMFWVGFNENETVIATHLETK